ncbi:MAG: T9SS type A sorting domain-containing protein [Bacteroidetes bacterium]|nr:T9SS type A sorting domain-containing protein [Bacteroidota bacterium]
MTKLYGLTIILLGLSFQATAQINISSGDMPKANDTFNYVTINPTSILGLLNQSGANQFWSVKVSPLSLKNQNIYKNSLNTPYAFYFFNTVGEKIADSIGLLQFKMEDVYQFYSSTSGAYKAKGMGFKISLAPIPLAGNYGTPDRIYKFPMNYGNRDSSGFDLNISIPLVGSYGQSGYRITEVIGFGKVVVVNDTFDCLQVRSDIVGSDSIEVQGVKFGIHRHTREYKWLTKQYRAPIVIVSGSVLSGQFVPGKAQYMDLQPKQSGAGSTGIDNPVPDQKTLLYPNPAQNHIFKTDEVVLVEAWNSIGQKQEIIWTNQTGHIDWSPGVYILKVHKTDGSSESMRLVVTQ